MNNVKKKNKDLEKKINFLEKENGNYKIKINGIESENAKLKKELIAANIRPSEKTIADKLNELKSKEMSLISANEILYRRVTKNMDNLVVDPFFYNEQVDLFMDRKIFFYETYGAIGEDVDVNKWTDGFQDVMGNDGTIPYQLVKNFDQIILKSLSINCHPFCKNFKPVYFERQ